MSHKPSYKDVLLTPAQAPAPALKPEDLEKEFNRRLTEIEKDYRVNVGEKCLCCGAYFPTCDYELSLDDEDIDNLYEWYFKEKRQIKN